MAQQLFGARANAGMTGSSFSLGMKVGGPAGM